MHFLAEILRFFSQCDSAFSKSPGFPCEGAICIAPLAQSHTHSLYFMARQPSKHRDTETASLEWGRHRSDAARRVFSLRVVPMRSFSASFVPGGSRRQSAPWMHTSKANKPLDQNQPGGHGFRANWAAPSPSVRVWRCQKAQAGAPFSRRPWVESVQLLHLHRSMSPLSPDQLQISRATGKRHSFFFDSGELLRLEDNAVIVSRTSNTESKVAVKVDSRWTS